MGLIEQIARGLDRPPRPRKTRLCDRRRHAPLDQQNLYGVVHDKAKINQTFAPQVVPRGLGSVPGIMIGSHFASRVPERVLRPRGRGMGGHPERGAAESLQPADRDAGFVGP